MPTTDELDARVRVLEERAGITPPATAPPTPGQKPATPGRPDVVLTKDATTLTWPAATDAARWEVRDELDPDPATRVKDVVTEPRSVRSAFKVGSRPRRYVIVAIGSAGLRSEPSAAVDVPPASAPAPAPSTPATGVDLSRWKLTIPESSGGKVVEISPPKLAGYSSKYWLPIAAGYRLRTWHSGATTSGSPNPRTELRELNADGSLAKWSIAGAGTTCEVVGQVNRLTKVRPHAVLQQIHGADDDVTVFRLEGTCLYITDGDNTHAHLVTAAFPLGQRYTLKMQAGGGEAGGGEVHYWYNGAPVDFVLKSGDTGSYWKAGLYLQSNPNSAPGESTDEYAEVELYSVTVSHTA